MVSKRGGFAVLGSCLLGFQHLGVNPVVQSITEDGEIKVSVTYNRDEEYADLGCTMEYKPVYKDIEIMLSFPGKTADKLQVL